MKIALRALFSRAYMCVQLKSSVHIRHSRWYLRFCLYLTLVRKVEIKLDENQAGGKSKIWSKSKPGQGLFMLDSSKFKRYRFQVLAVSTNTSTQTVTGEWQTPCHKQPGAVTRCTNSSTEGGPHCKATWKLWTQWAETSTCRWDRGSSQAVTDNPFSESCWQVITTSIYRSSSTSTALPPHEAARGTRRCCRLNQLMVFEKIPLSPQGLFFVMINWTDMTKHTWKGKLKYKPTI